MDGSVILPVWRTGGTGALTDLLAEGRPARGSTTGCPIMALFDLIGRRWTLRVIWELEQAGKPLTFRELRTACGDLSSSVLTRRLHELTEALIVERSSAGYALTSIGRALVGSLEPVLAWARDWSRALAKTRAGAETAQHQP